LPQYYFAPPVILALLSKTKIVKIAANRSFLQLKIHQDAFAAIAPDF